MVFPTSSRIGAILLVFVAAVTFLVISKSEYLSPSLRQQQHRQLSSPSLGKFTDPKSISIRHPEAFSYRFSSEEKNCIEPQEVEELAKLLRQLYEQYGVRVFPRNGFLLGIIRHGGYLPNEKIPDADLGIISTDVERLARESESRINRIQVGDGLQLLTRPSEDNWVSWQGRDPTTGEQYPFFGVRIVKVGTDSTFLNQGIRANAIYPYTRRGPGAYFFPRVNLAAYNHKSHTEEMLRYNSEGADYRLLDTDDPLTQNNNQDGLQIGTVYNTNFDCMVLKQFYFTMIYVPCDYEAILDASYGKNWNHVENRGREGKGSFPAMKLSKKKNLESLQSGPKPLCPYGAV